MTLRNLRKIATVAGVALGLLFASTVLAASQGTVSATLSGSINPNGRLTTVWFEYGTDANLAKSNETPHASISAGMSSIPFTEDVTGLTPDTTYYFRIVTDNGEQETKGNILSFKTISLAANAPGSGEAGASQASAVSTENMLSIKPAADSIPAGSETDYVITFDNNTGAELDDAVIFASLPNELSLSDANGGTVEPDGRLLFKLGTVTEGQSGIITFKAKVNDLARDAGTAVVTAEMSYYTPGAPDLAKNETAYAVTNISDGSALAASIFNGSSFLFLPLFIWIILILLVLVIIIAVRKSLLRKKAGGDMNEDEYPIRPTPGPKNS
ncbi:MAG TPA: fibronectin type III domain-containing protein [Candidatus Paceibacterota bacterium]|nr:fibronectin type III domain-containing protein [Candidatus Paceibacterota bacterium]